VQGGIKVKDPVIDLAFCAALISSALDIPLRPDEAFLGEVGILAQTYPAPLLARRLTEAARLGFRRAYVPPFKGEKPKVKDLEIISVPDASALRAALEKATAASKGDKK
jgi:DNA repair protein RadA/Sms